MLPSSMPNNQFDLLIPDLLNLHVNVTQRLGQFAPWALDSHKSRLDRQGNALRDLKLLILVNILHLSTSSNHCQLQCQRNVPLRRGGCRGQIMDRNWPNFFINPSIYPHGTWGGKNGMKRVTYLSSLRICLFRATIMDRDVSATRRNGARCAEFLVMRKFSKPLTGAHSQLCNFEELKSLRRHIPAPTRQTTLQR